MSNPQMSGAGHWLAAEALLEKILHGSGWSDGLRQAYALQAMAHATLAAAAASYGWHRALPPTGDDT